jgi:hypothetical protein
MVEHSRPRLHAAFLQVSTFASFLNRTIYADSHSHKKYTILYFPSIPGEGHKSCILGSLDPSKFSWRGCARQTRAWGLSLKNYCKSTLDKSLDQSWAQIAWPRLRQELGSALGTDLLRTLSYQAMMAVYTCSVDGLSHVCPSLSPALP